MESQQSQRSREKAVSMLKSMGVLPEEGVRRDKELTKKGARDNRICICGHPMTRHTITPGGDTCKPSRMTCHCNKAAPVLEVEDTRLFTRKSNGYGADHALSRAMAVSIQIGKTDMRFISENYKCMAAGCSANKNLTPVLFEQTSNGYDLVLDVSARGRSTGFVDPFTDFFLCPSCLTKALAKKGVN